MNIFVVGIMVIQHPSLQASKVFEVREVPYSQLKGSACPEGVDPTNKEVNPVIQVLVVHILVCIVFFAQLHMHGHTRTHTHTHTHTHTQQRDVFVCV